ncbi:CgeB family protein [Listeria grandensis]|uniref:CgeB family protein n=1 Tax=Listeria grandensis TaxID=1494963 RepID=UPI00164E070B|nr:glycosyltransferase [Listeria grandensis]MBC6314372.1 glycosyltransferase [Listeria grandensis]
MIDINELYEEIEAVQKEILDDTNPNIVDVKQLNAIENWHSPSQKLVTYEQSGHLYISSSDAGYDYLTFLENNNVFTREPEHGIPVLPKETLELHFEAEMMGNVSAKLALIEYNHSEKCNVTFYDPNKEVKIILSEETTQVRLALKVTHAGVTIVKRIQLERVVASEVSKRTASHGVMSHAPAIKRLKDLQVACIFDEFTRTCYEKEVQLLPITPTDWRDVLTENRPHFLFVESAWKGNYGAWEFKIATYNNQSKAELFELLDWCKEQGIPTVFWNKEDPIHFDKFIDTAERFDYIYTTDADMIPKYQERAGHTNVFAQSFAVQPSMHNPIALAEPRVDKMCFAGSYYGNRHEERRKDMEDVLDVALDYGLAIYDRNHGKPLKDKAMFEFPERYQPAVLGSLPYSEMELAYKGYKYMININSIKYSPTMFSRRVFEGLASGTPVLSSYSKGIRRLFGDVVMISEDTDKLHQQMQAITKDDQIYDQKSLAGIRAVYREHTYQHRLASMLGDLQLAVPKFTKNVTVMAVARSKRAFLNILKQYQAQTYQGKKLVVFVTMFDEAIQLMNQYNTADISVFVHSYMSHYDKITEVIDTDYFAYFSDSHFYGKYYLEDLVHAGLYSEADFIGKSKARYEFVTDLHFQSSLVAANWHFGKKLPKLLQEMEENASLAPYLKQGARLFSADTYNFIENSQKIKLEDRQQIEI